MTTLIDSMVERAKADKKTIVLPEGTTIVSWQLQKKP